MIMDGVDGKGDEVVEEWNRFSRRRPETRNRGNADIEELKRQSTDLSIGDSPRLTRSMRLSKTYGNAGI